LNDAMECELFPLYPANLLIHGVCRDRKCVFASVV
jgi:hypothetical protein